MGEATRALQVEVWQPGNEPINQREGAVALSGAIRCLETKEPASLEMVPYSPAALFSPQGPEAVAHLHTPPAIARDGSRRTMENCSRPLRVLTFVGGEYCGQEPSPHPLY
ncbi:hypothetical protein MRX96_034737 [Rhipicephalus microplus]